MINLKNFIAVNLCIVCFFAGTAIASIVYCPEAVKCTSNTIDSCKFLTGGSNFTLAVYNQPIAPGTYYFSMATVYGNA